MKKENIIFVLMLFIGTLYGIVIVLIETFLPKIIVEIILCLFVLYTIFKLIKNKNKNVEHFNKLKSSVENAKISLSFSNSIISMFICLWIGSLIPLFISNSNYVNFITAYFLFVGTIMYIRIRRLQ